MISGIEYGFINNSINLLGQDLRNLTELNGNYTDLQGNNHKIISIPYDVKERSIDNIDQFNSIVEEEFILDLDLDFMTKLNENQKNVPLGVANGSSNGGRFCEAGRLEKANLRQRRGI